MNKKSNYKTLAVIALKSPKIIKLFKVIKLFKFAKPFITILSLALSLFAYTAAYSFSLAVSILLLIMIHELGHVVAINKEGFKAKTIVFIPFIGAVIGAPKDLNRRQEAVIAIGGPWLGSLGALAFIPLYLATNNDWFLHSAYLGVVVNLFNMIPISPIDGGRITQAVGPYFSILGLMLLIAVTIVAQAPTLLLIWMICLHDFKWFGVITRFIIMSLIQIAIVVCLISGLGLHSKIDFWVLLADAIIGLSLLVSMYLSLRLRSKHSDITDETIIERPPLSTRQRLIWFFVWFGTTATLSVSLLLIANEILKHKPH